jgi:hypothetical protein
MTARNGWAATLTVPAGRGACRTAYYVTDGGGVIPAEGDALHRSARFATTTAARAAATAAAVHVPGTAPACTYVPSLAGMPRVMA